ncbi:dihydropteroate synthase-like protein [Methanolobus halotolerans]|uniref:Dihydropteroate synthase-like protein n=1 Tax=Methanolobus halotolerans TaxID=2052935 RepID=A0A4E0PWC0_9EURY|nr:dihydropteroate synthase-like protein [Methanolobus halotolerans]TGC08742.1 dihydropteroate synthase-like protein [Methanolobus halotolerans]
MKVLVATGHLAEQTVRDSVGMDTDVLIVDTQIAAFITPRKLMAAIEADFPQFTNNKAHNAEYDLILIPGLVSGDFSRLARKLRCKIRLGPKHAYDLGFVLNFVGSVEFSTELPACELLADVRREMALEKVKQLEELAVPLMTVGELKFGGDSRMKVMAEVVDATGQDTDTLSGRIESFVRKGADIIDLGASLHAEADDVEHAIKVAKSVTSLPVSIDTLDPGLLSRALDIGVDMVLSLDSSNISTIAPRLASSDVASVIIPDSGEGLDSLIRNINEARRMGVRKIIADPVLDPIGHEIASSIVRYSKFHEMFPEIPIFFGVGNVTELIDADSTGVNATLCGIAADLGVSILFTPEYSNKTQGSIKELKKASQMMMLTKERKSSPKDLGIDLIEIKEKRRRTDAVMPDNFVRAEKSRMWTVDPKGSIRINVIPESYGKGGYILAEHDSVSIVGRSAGEVMDTILDMKLVSRMEHAAYLGQELKKAELALKFGRSYSQDDKF